MTIILKRKQRPGKVIPYGFDSRFPKEAETLKEMYLIHQSPDFQVVHLFPGDLTRSYLSTSRELNKRGFRNRGGIEWTYGRVWQLLNHNSFTREGDDLIIQRL